MGHYSECYEEDTRKAAEYRNEVATRALKELTKDLSLVDKEFLVKIVGNLDRFKSMFGLIKYFCE